ncbi:hypothetical protein [Tropicibacter oceani]|uniref:Uncharacterized protein n=1 Tax=Tropicibacter oceani TaxID=3058420 RepID=A0ABY8QCN9_9RHOB|nr:hypothetical protein [Tropicibacter oceani]WGW02325.1 hypothetical protein QF118_10210 [Tropicibacter oceani]
MTERYRIEKRDGRVHVMARSAASAVWYSLGGAGDVTVTLRLWLALIKKDHRK